MADRRQPMAPQVSSEPDPSPRPAIDVQIIADPPDGPGRTRARVLALVALGSATLGAVAAWHYGRLDLALSHYDARGHLVVARRIIDSLTPGWRQVGAVWLPLPHLLNALPVQVDALYRTGASAIALSVASHAAACTALAYVVVRATGTPLLGVAAAAVLAADPNVLYLQATPMTEPLLLGLMLASVAFAYRWLADDDERAARLTGLTLAGACLTRYEAWPFTALLVGLALLVRLSQTGRVPATLASMRPIVLAPFAAVVAFFLLSRATVGAWFVTGGFYVPDNAALGRPFLAAAAVWWGLRHVAGTATAAIGLLGLFAAGVYALRRRPIGPELLTWALVGCAALPWYAFVSGHPFRIRYMVVLTGAVAAGAGLGLGLLPRRARTASAVVLLALALVEAPPFSASAPMLLEAQWDRPYSIGRRAVTRCLVDGFRRPEEKVLASMGSLAHYMHELSREGFALRDFVHEGQGDLWDAALASPRRHVEWILFEERAEGGDLLTALRRERPSLVDGFARVCEGGGVALYRRR